MKQRTYEGLKFLIDILVVALFVVWLGLMLKPAHASGDKIIQDVDQNVSVQQASDAWAENNNAQNANNQNKTDNFAVGLNHSLGSAQIGDYLTTKQKGNPLWSQQGTKLNKFQAAIWADGEGLHAEAARLRCNINAIREMYTTLEECMEKWTVSRVDSSTPDETVSQLQFTISELQSIIREQQAAQSAANERIANLEEEAEKQRKRAQRPQAKPQTIIKQESRYTDEEREAILALKFE